MTQTESLTSTLQGTKIVVAMSGGVDSSVAALLLWQQGFNIVGVSMQVWDYRNKGGCSSRATCCAPDDFTDARKVAAKIGVPYYVVDFEQSFKREVIDNFASTYARGQTPNPCIDCNSKVKFRELRDRAKTMGFGAVATGHYARIKKTPRGSHLLRGVDSEKDQSYFLYGITQAELGSTVFPVGHLTKSEVRELARTAGLATASKPESQDVCFVSTDLDTFLVGIGVTRRAGDITDRTGAKLGAHDGIHQFTVGQRRGLAVGGSDQPLYVLEIDPTTNQVIVGPKAELAREGFIVEQCSWLSPDYTSLEIGFRFKAIAQLRHRHVGVAVEVEIIDQDRIKASFQTDWSVVSPGQAAVFYDLQNQEVLGGGRIV